MCRQTDLIASIVTKGIQINIKKGQFLSPYAVKDIVEKCRHYGDRELRRVMITERGTTFGYQNLVVDMTGLQIIKDTNKNIPLIIDGTHAVQQPATTDGKSGGNRTFVENLVKAALVYKLAGVFIETHDDPDKVPYLSTGQATGRKRNKQEENKLSETIYTNSRSTALAAVMLF